MNKQGLIFKPLLDFINVQKTICHKYRIHTVYIWFWPTLDDDVMKKSTSVFCQMCVSAGQAPCGAVA